MIKHVVTRKLPAGVVLITTHSEKLLEAVDVMFDFFNAGKFGPFKRTEVSANVPILMTLEVPQEHVKEAAKALREMADELEATK